ncbi:MAG: septal ring lytic transglycosylase RlpA family protein, partial [Bdellovibrionales bacterium]
MIRKMALCGMVLMLAACSTTNSSSRTTGTRIAKNQTPIAKSDQSAGVFKVGNTYSVKGKRYQPRETYSFSETGTASWYGPQFHGKKTANGEVFDKYELTAAHKTLQMPSMIKVTNLDNGRSAILRVNDRGPFARGRIIDMSKR